MTLWDLIAGNERTVVAEKPTARELARKAARRRAVPRSGHVSVVAFARPQTHVRVLSDSSMQAKYDAMVEAMLGKYGVRVRKWRTSMSGVAWTLTYRDGSVKRLIESPRPKGPMSAAVFLHEIGHHAIGLGVYRPRCLEEFHAWDFALKTMAELGLNVTDGVRNRMHDSLYYAVAKARRRSLKSLPAELEPFSRPRAR
jgi:hypothetical protein